MRIHEIIMKGFRIIHTTCSSVWSVLFKQRKGLWSSPPRSELAYCKQILRERLTNYTSTPSIVHADKPKLCKITDQISLRHAVPGDIKHLVKMTQEEGWWYTDFEYNVLLQLDPFSITVATNEANIPVGFIGICNVLPGIIYNGPFIIRDNYRGKGIGSILNIVMEELQADRNGCMDLDFEFVEHYGQKGFIHKSYQFKIFKVIVDDFCRDTDENDSIYEIAPLTNELFPIVLEYDRGVFNGLDRERILRACLFGDSVYTVASLCDGSVNGYGSLNKLTAKTYSISTLFADNEAIVEEILGNMLERVPTGATLTLQLVADKRLSERFSVFESLYLMQRVYNKFEIETDLDRMYYVNDYML